MTSRLAMNTKAPTKAGDPSFGPLSPDRLGALAAVLAAEHLPIDDLGEPGRRFFAFSARTAAPEATADSGDTLIAAGGLERYGMDALLRSVVTLPATRGQGWGRALVTRLEEQAKAEGVRRLWVLTLNAAPFFRLLGYTATPRDHAPSVIQATRQFASLCPASAILLSKAV